MQAIKITTSQNIDIEYEVASLGDRILGRIVDFGVALACYYVFYFIFIIFFFGDFEKLGKGDGSVPVFLIVLLIVFSLINVFYDLICEIFFNGRSIGKYALKMRVVSLDGARPSISQFLLRWVFRLVDFVITFGIGALISVAVSSRKQRIGDMVAGTVVIKTTPKAQLDQLFFKPLDENYEPRFPQVTELTDNDMGLVYEVITNFKATGNSSVVYNMSLRLQDHLKIQIPSEFNDFQFLEKLAEDYNYYTSQSVS